MRSALGLAVATAATAVAAGGCSLIALEERPDDRPAATFTRIDEVAGAYGPVTIGDGKKKLFDAFGPVRPVGANEELVPSGAAGSHLTAPPSLPLAAHYCYVDACFWLDERPPGLPEDEDFGEPGRGRVEGFEVTSPGARTLRGVRIGDDLDDVRRAYPELRCDEIPPREPLFPTPGFPYCSGEVADDRWLWIGGSPIDYIAVAAFPLE